MRGRLSHSHQPTRHMLSWGPWAASRASGCVSEERSCTLPGMSSPLPPTLWVIALCSVSPSPPVCSPQQFPDGPETSNQGPRCPSPAVTPSPVSPCPLFPPYLVRISSSNTACSFAKHFNFCLSRPPAYLPGTSPLRSLPCSCPYWDS